MKNAVVIGATSGIGRAMAVELSRAGYAVCVTGRRVELLESLAAELSGGSFYQRMDVADTDAAAAAFEQIADRMGTVDLVVVNAGVRYRNPELSLAHEQETIAVNVTGFTAMANAAYHLFTRQQRGHLVGISSVAGLRGGPAAAYNASKAYVSAYLEGLRLLAAKAGLPIVITDIRPGFVDTDLVRGDGLFWVQPVDKAARQIIGAIQKQKKRAYITKRWILIAWLMRLTPDWLYYRYAE